MKHLIQFNLRTFIGIALLLSFMACKKADECCQDDYRTDWIGTYEGTKSNRGYEDDQFTTPIEVTILADSLSNSSLIINDITIPVDENGIFKLAEIDGNYYEVELKGNELKMTINIIFPLGDALACYIKATKF